MNRLNIWPLVACTPLLLMASCVEEHPHEEINPDVYQGEWETMQRGLGVGEVTGCSLAAVRVLDQQIIDEMNCLTPDTLVSFEDLNIEQAGTSTWAYLQPPAKEALRRVIADRGIRLRVNSVYRTIAQQYLLYRWYLEGRCGIGLAAQPGRSNHQSGLAIDLSDYTGWRPHLEDNGWQWLGSNDPVHFDYRGSGTSDIRGTAVLAFQRLWNRNNPGDRIDEDGVYGAQTEARLRQSPADGFTTGATCDDPDPPDPGELAVTLSGSLREVDGQPRDLVTDGASAGIFDLLEGQRVEADVIVRNGAARLATDELIVGFEMTRPANLALVGYTIWSDHPELDGQSWQLNDANDNPDNPARDDPGVSGFMNLYRFSPGESKRVTLVLEAREHSAPEHAEVRFWLKHVGGYYGEMDGWDDPVETNQAGELLRWSAQIDVFDPERIGGGDDVGVGDTGMGDTGSDDTGVGDTGASDDTGGGPSMDSGVADTGTSADTTATTERDSAQASPDTPDETVEEDDSPQKSTTNEGCATAPGHQGSGLWGLWLLAGFALWRRR